MSSINITLSDDEFQIKLAQVLVNTEVAMEAIDDTESESDRVEQKVQTLKIESERDYRQILAAGRRTAAIVRGLAIASGQAFAEIYAIGIEVALLTAELLIDVATAEAMTVVGTISAVAKIGTILALLRKARQLEAGQSRAASETEGIIMTLSALTFLALIDPFWAWYIIKYFLKFIWSIFP